MTVQYDSIPFSVVLDDGSLPSPTFDDEGFSRYIAEISVPSSSNVNQLRSRFSIVTPRLALGFVGGGTLFVQAGVGSKVLVFPTNGGERTFNAILVGFSVLDHLGTDTYWRGQAEWILLDEVV